MALSFLKHSSKVNHYFAPSDSLIASFFDSVTGLYASGAHTDLRIICSGDPIEDDEEAVEAARGQGNELKPTQALRCFRVHQMMLLSHSRFLKDIIDALPNIDCNCDERTIYIPDFKARTVRNFLSVLYTGASIGETTRKDLADLNSLMIALGVDIKNLSQGSSPGRSPFPENVEEILNTRLPATDEVPAEYSDESGAQNFTLDDSEAGENNDGNFEVTPEVQMFVDGHFLSGTGEEDESDQKRKDVENIPINNIAGSSTDYKIDAKSDFGGEEASDKSPQQNNEMLENRNYVCRLCGKTCGNGASLFAHLLYPHYAHLWKDEIPKRAARYDCRECTYNTGKRQHYVMHVARVHEELKKKLAAAGENLEILDNLTQKGNSHAIANNNSRIISKLAKGINDSTSEVDNQYLKEEIESSPYFRKNNRDSIDSNKGINNVSASTSSPMSSSLHSLAALSQQHSLMAGLVQNAQQSPNAMLHQEHHHQPQQLAAPAGGKPYVKCRICGKAWKGKDNFFTHLVSTHFKHFWAKEVPKQSDMYRCHINGCSYQSKYRYNFLFHLAGKHKQLKQRLAAEGIPLEVLTPLDIDSNEEILLQQQQTQNYLAAAMAATAAATSSGNLPPELASNPELFAKTQLQNMLRTVASSAGSIKQQQTEQQLAALRQNGLSIITKSKPGPKPANGVGQTAANTTTKLVCRVCKKLSYNHTCHRQHVVGKHFQHFWSNLRADGEGRFHCHHTDCSYNSPNRSVFVIHLAYVHQELRQKLIQSGENPDIALPDVYGKRKYSYRNSLGGGSPSLGGSQSPLTASNGNIEDDEDVSAPAAMAIIPKSVNSVVSARAAFDETDEEAEVGGSHMVVKKFRMSGDDNVEQIDDEEGVPDDLDEEEDDEDDDEDDGGGAEEVSYEEEYEEFEDEIPNGVAY